MPCGTICMRNRRLAFLASGFLVTVATCVAIAAEPDDAALASPSPWARFLAEAFPEGLDPERSRKPHTIRDPGPDTANYPNSPNTLPRGGIYLETSPVFFTGAMSTIQPQTYNFEYLLRMGLTDRVEFRLFSSGFTWQAAGLGQGATTGVSPITFDTKIHFWEENADVFLPAVGFEAFVQTPWGSPAFNAGATVSRCSATGAQAPTRAAPPARSRSASPDRSEQHLGRRFVPSAAPQGVSVVGATCPSPSWVERGSYTPRNTAMSISNGRLDTESSPANG